MVGEGLARLEVELDLEKNRYGVRPTEEGEFFRSMTKFQETSPAIFGTGSVGWKIEGQDINGVDTPFLIVERRILGVEGIERIEAPLKIDLRKIFEMARSQPPYESKSLRKGPAAWDVPWQRVDIEIGATLGYLYPPKKPD